MECKGLKAAKILLTAFICITAGTFPASNAELQIHENDKVPDETGRIVGGKDAKNGMFPWTAALYNSDQYICTASIVSPKTILTAAHCVNFNGETQPASEFFVVVGNVDRTQARKVQISNVTVHPQYKYENLINDIAFLQAEDPITFDENTKPICLADTKSKTRKDKRKNVTVMGWGKTNRADTTGSTILQYAPHVIIPIKKCRLLYGYLLAPGEDYKNQICARGNLFTRSGICSGDSGGPLVYLNGGKNPIQIGITSYISKTGACSPYNRQPSIFTRVSKYADWLRQNTGDDDLCFV